MTWTPAARLWGVTPMLCRHALVTSLPCPFQSSKQIAPSYAFGSMVTTAATVNGARWAPAGPAPFVPGAGRPQALANTAITAREPDLHLVMRTLVGRAKAGDADEITDFLFASGMVERR